jgi:hypothetical protein
VPDVEGGILPPGYGVERFSKVISGKIGRAVLWQPASGVPGATRPTILLNSEIYFKNHSKLKLGAKLPGAALQARVFPPGWEARLSYLLFCPAWLACESKPSWGRLPVCRREGDRKRENVRLWHPSGYETGLESRVRHQPTNGARSGNSHREKTDR